MSLLDWIPILTKAEVFGYLAAGRNELALVLTDRAGARRRIRRRELAAASLADEGGHGRPPRASRAILVSHSTADQRKAKGILRQRESITVGGQFGRYRSVRRRLRGARSRPDGRSDGERAARRLSRRRAGRACRRDDRARLHPQRFDGAAQTLRLARGQQGCAGSDQPIASTP